MAQKRPFNRTITDDRDLRCPVCLDDFTKPKQLPCCHTFCLRCLEMMCSPYSRTTPTARYCPLCRTKFDVPLNGPVSLPDNDFILRILLEKDLSAKNLSAIKKKLRICDSCVKQGKDEKAEFFCFNCKNDICSACKEFHSEINHMKLHKIVDLGSKPTEEELEQLKLDYCDSHGKEIEFYCSTCNVMLCCVCLLLEHREHECALKKNISDLKKEAAAIDIGNIEKLNKVEADQLKDIRDQETQIQSHALEIRRAMRELFHEIYFDITIRESELLAKLNELEKDHKLMLQSRKSQVEYRAEKLNGFLEHGKMLMERGTDSEIIMGSDDFHKRFDSLVDWFENNRNTQDDLPEKSLVIQLNQPLDLLERLKTLTDSLDVSACTAKDFASKFLSETSVQVIEEQKDAAGVTVVEDQVFVIQFQTLHINVFDSVTLKPRPSIQVQKLKSPTYITGCPVNKLLYVSDSESRYIHRVQLSDSSGRSWNCVAENSEHNWVPLGLSVTSKQTLLVSGIFRDNEGQHVKSKLVELSSEGTLVKDIDLDERIKSLWHTVPISGDRLILCHGSGSSSLHRLCTISYQGGVIKTYGAEKERGEGQLYQPSSISVDPNTKLIFLADQWNHRVLIFSSALNLMGEVHFGMDLRYPSSVFFDSCTKKLFVTERYTGKVYAISANDS